MSKDAEPSPAEIAGQIFVVRGKRVIMDSELAKLYGTETRVLNQAVRRNRERFPGDFVLELTHQEVMRSRSQSVILNAGRGSNVKHPPLAFNGFAYRKQCERVRSVSNENPKIAALGEFLMRLRAMNCR